MFAKNPLNTRKLATKRSMLGTIGIILFTMRLVTSNSITRNTLTCLQRQWYLNFLCIYEDDYNTTAVLNTQKRELERHITAINTHLKIYEETPENTLKKIKTLGDEIQAFDIKVDNNTDEKLGCANERKTRDIQIRDFENSLNDAWTSLDKNDVLVSISKLKKDLEDEKGKIYSEEEQRKNETEEDNFTREMYIDESMDTERTSPYADHDNIQRLLIIEEDKLKAIESAPHTEEEKVSRINTINKLKNERDNLEKEISKLCVESKDINREHYDKIRESKKFENFEKLYRIRIILSSSLDKIDLETRMNVIDNLLKRFKDIGDNKEELYIFLLNSRKQEWRRYLPHMGFNGPK